jgi:hypothetical protein
MGHGFWLGAGSGQGPAGHGDRLAGARGLRPFGVRILSVMTLYKFIRVSSYFSRGVLEGLYTISQK